jgi:hypothetical protein
MPEVANIGDYIRAAVDNGVSVDNATARQVIKSGVPWVVASLVRNRRGETDTMLIEHPTGLGPGCIDRFRERRLQRGDCCMVDLWARIPPEDALPSFSAPFRAIDAALSARGNPPPLRRWNTT